MWIGSFQAPWDWRAQHTYDARTPAAPAFALGSSSGCSIKGNISVSTGERIYHVPGQEHYDETVITVSKGERWFCSELEAISAGWRKAKR
ncbi:hypothetical protein [Mesorhizobium sp.]|uniref:sunset domain-containing protein n=1 Tax=Mesorhizobium sp. TaxID=1871066 RepID=UPI0025DBB72F|nr:hypothetical protein [Mesorhizobium sp.]